MDKPPSADEDDIASVYLRRMRGGDSAPKSAPAAQQKPPPVEGGDGVGTAPSSAEAHPAAPHVAAAPPAAARPDASDAITDAEPPPPPQRAPTATHAAQAEGDDSALPLGAPMVFNAATQVEQINIDPGGLPRYFATEGLVALRKGDFNAAAEYYQEQAKVDPSRAEGWLGLGAALFGVGDNKKAITYLNKGAEIDTTFPVGPLLAEVKPDKPQVIFKMAELFLAVDELTSINCATSVCEDLMKSPMTPKSLYTRAAEMKKKCRDRLDEKELSDNPKLLAMKKKAEQQRFVSAFVRYLITFALIGGLGYGGWWGYHFGQCYRYKNMGFIDYQEGYRLSSTGQTSLNSTKNATDPYDLYYKAFTEYHQATEFMIDDYKAHFMTVKAGGEVLQLANDGKAKSASAETLGEVERGVRESKTEAQRLDPSGALAKQCQTELTNSLSR